jgi:predicted transcriptional regulator
VNSLSTDKRRITITLDDDLNEWLERTNDETGTSRTAIVVAALRKVMEMGSNATILNLSAEVLAGLAQIGEKSFRSATDEARYALSKYVREESKKMN